jgi:holin-like protein
MNILKQFAIILAFCLAAEIPARLLPVKLPAGVWGIVILFTAFSVKILEPKSIDQTSRWLLANMGLFFLPPAIAIINQFDLLKSAVVRFFIAGIVTTVITFLITYSTVYIVRRIINKFTYILKFKT